MPACPIPIQNTKLVMSQRPPDRMIQSPRADSGRNLVAETERPKPAIAEVTANATHHQRGARLFHRTGDAFGEPAVSYAGSISAARG